ncbi:MAG: FUSC family protein [Terriglobales bacterium]
MASAKLFSGVNRDSILDSVRTTFAAIAALLLARMLKLPEYYWAPISAIVVAQSTIPPRTLGWQRLVGTALGALLGAAIATYFGRSALVYAVGIFLCGMLAWFLRLGSAYRFAAITLSIILLINRGLPPRIAAWHRFLEVSLGIAVALVITTVWPLTKKTAHHHISPR